MNLAFHVFAAILLVGLGYFIFVLQKQNLILLNVLKSNFSLNKKTVTIDYPHLFLKGVAAALKIEVLDESQQLKSIPPVKCDHTVVYHFLCYNLVESIQFHDVNQKTSVKFVVSQILSDNICDTEKELEHALGLPCSIVLKN